VSQFQPVHIKSTAKIQALPHTAVKGLKRSPFAIMFTGAWTFNSAAGMWRPKMLTPSLQSGVNQDGADLAKLGKIMQDKAAKSASVRVFLTGDTQKLGKYGDFLTRYPVRLLKGGVVAHYALVNETYHEDALGRIYRKIDSEWLDGLFTHVVKAGFVYPPSIADRDAAISRLEASIKTITNRLERPGVPVEALEMRRCELVKRRDAMLAAFAKQFPNAAEIPADLSPVVFGAAGQDFQDSQGEDDDDAPM